MGKCKWRRRVKSSRRHWLLASGSGCHEGYILICSFILEAKRSISGLPNFLIMLFKSSELSWHSLALFQIQDCSSVTVLVFPGRAADIQNLFLMEQWPSG